MKALFLTLLVCYSCTDYASLSKESVGMEVSSIEMDLSYLKEIEWIVGPKKKVDLSQSFSFMVELPKLKEKDIDYLIKERSIDAWVIRLISRKGSTEQDLGALYVLFRSKKFSRTSHASTPSSVSLKVYYAAAYASERFRAFKCPAFSHNKKITSMRIEDSENQFSLPLQTSSPFHEKISPSELTPTSFNGGHSLKGEYFLELTAYDSKNKTLHSPFKRIPESIVVEGEEAFVVSGCEGVHQEYQ